MVKKGGAVAQKGLQQFHDRIVVEPKKPKYLRHRQQIKRLAYVMFLELNNGEVTSKLRGFTYGRKQRNCPSKDNTSPPNISTESLMLSCMIDAIEGKDVVTDDIQGAFLQIYSDKEDIFINMEG